MEVFSLSPVCFEAANQPARLLWGLAQSLYLQAVFPPLSASFDPGVPFHSHNATCLSPQLLCPAKNTSQCCGAAAADCESRLSTMAKKWQHCWFNFVRQRWQTTGLSLTSPNVVCLDKSGVFPLSRGWNKFMLRSLWFYSDQVFCWWNQTGKRQNPRKQKEQLYKEKRESGVQRWSEVKILLFVSSPEPLGLIAAPIEWI